MNKYQLKFYMYGLYMFVIILFYAYTMGEIFITAEQKVNRWREYLEELYAVQLSGDVLEKKNCVKEENKGDCSLQSEIDFAIKILKTKKHVA